MRTLKLTLAYDGTQYSGWQRQQNGLAIQQVVEEALAPMVARRDAESRRGAETGRGPTIAGAGRTDAGVHALGQVASVHVEFDYAPSAVQRALNIRLPEDIRVVGVVDAAPGFHAQFHARGKTYRYRIATTPIHSPFDRWFVWHAPMPRDLDAMRRAAAFCVGTHDFASFQARGTSVTDTVRTLARCDVREHAGEIVVEVEGDGFLRHMVRIIVGTLSEIGAGARPVESMAAMIAARDRSSAGLTAPASGLTLVSVRY
ncbi:MAG TPA: tRNA pseudouridine(38-40) synthase TruA [Vicinamibacterales bacterium]|nr:tRNA pseudouridine(38-40) synthase TruA [Vicinamibacterales bacterium]